MNLSARQLRAFLALVDTKNFTRAAQQCHLTQPAFSALIRSLEDSVHLKLFDRSTRHVALTVEGKVFEVAARRLLVDMELAIEDLHDYAAKRRGRVTVAALPSLAAGWLPGLIAQFRLAHPGITVILHDALLDPCLNMVQSGQADLAVASHRPDMADLDSQFLHADRYYLVCRTDHALAHHETVTLSALLHYPLIQFAQGSSVRKHLDTALGRFTPISTFEVEHLATVAGLVRAGLGISVVPAMTLFHFTSPDLRIIPLAGTAITRPLYVVQRKGRSVSVAAQAFTELLMQHRGSLEGVLPL